MNRVLHILTVCVVAGCSSDTKEVIKNEVDTSSTIANDKIKVLNFATFHMGATTDEHNVEFDEANKKNQEDARKIAQMISGFKPTVICVEVPPNKNEDLNTQYKAFLDNPEELSSYYGEVGLVAFEVGRINKVAQLYGIDHKMEYNYNIDEDLINVLDSTTFNKFKSGPFESIPELNIFEEGLSLMEKLSRMNHPKFLDFLITANADILTHVGTKDGFEGADEAARYYQRNLRIYSNLNRLPIKESDRVFILSGGSHTAFLNEFMKRSLKYEVVDTFDYLK